MKKRQKSSRRKSKKNMPIANQIEIKEEDHSDIKISQTIQNIPKNIQIEKTPSQKQKTRIFDFLRQVRAEAMRVSWPTRNETLVTTFMVFIMVSLAAVFFLIADQILSMSIAWIFGNFSR